MVRPAHLEDHALVAARRLRQTILASLAVASPLLMLAAGCSPAPPSGEEGGVTTNPGSNDGNADSLDADVDSGSSMSSMSSESGLMDESGSTDEESESGMKLDLEYKYDIPPPAECWVAYLTEAEVVAAHPDCALGPFDPNNYTQFYEVCVTHPADGDCSDICPPDMMCEGMGDCYWWGNFGMCGPYETEEACCLIVAGEQPPPEGRPFVIAGEARLAWVDAAPRDRVTAHWLEVARGEHASIAAFARFVAVLQRHGAPARLVADALAAAGDEARHAEQTLALAKRFGGQALEFGPLEIDDALDDVDDLAAALRAAVREGCIDETLAAHEAACLAAMAKDVEVAAVLEQIASDEARHAALAWRFVAWVLERRPELRSVVIEVFASVAAPRVVESDELEPHDVDALALGCPPARLRATWRRLGLREMVLPCAAQLLGDSNHEVRA